MSSIFKNPGALLFLGFTAVFVFYCFKKPLLLLFKILVRGALFSFIIFLINFITLSFDFHIGLNPATYALCGIFGGYGVILNYALCLMF